MSIICMKTYEARWITIAKEFFECALQINPCGDRKGVRRRNDLFELKWRKVPLQQRTRQIFRFEQS